MGDEHEAFYESFDPTLGDAVRQVRAMVSDGSLQDLILGELASCGERYQDHTPLAKGGMKSILQVCDAATGRDVAMAVIPADSSNSVIESFLREARITALLQHPNIMPVYDIGLDDDERPFFTMKLVVGDGLDSILDNLRDDTPGYAERYPLSTLIDIFQKVCEAVAYAHSRGVIHLDIKPANVQVSDFGEVMLLDWGLARVLDEHCEDSEIARYSLDMHAIETISARGFIKGTPGYMAPEQTRADEKGKHTDIYALGAVLYCILTYEAPIGAGDITSIVRATRDGSIVPPIERCPHRNISSSLNAICMKALASNPARRYAAAADLLADLANWRAGYATEAEDAGFLTHLRLLIARHSGIVGTAAIAIMVLVGVASSFVLRLSQANHEAQSALAALRAEEIQRKELAARNATHRMQAAEKAFGDFRHDDALRDARSVLDLVPGHAQAQFLLGRIQFIQGNFADSASSLADGPADLRALAAFAADIASRDRLVEEMPELLALLAEFPDLRPHCLRDWPARLLMLPQRRYALAERQLLIDNPGLKAEKFTFDVETRNFTLINAPRFRNADALAWLPLRHLDLRNTGVADLAFLRSQQLLTLKLAGCPVADLTPLADNTIEVLDLARTLAEELSPLQSLPLVRLDISGLGVRDPRPLAEHPTLREIVAYEYQFAGPRRRRISEAKRLIEVASPPVAVTAQRRRRQLRIFDRNRDGSLQLPEFPWPLGLFASLDSNEDDRISEAEFHVLGLPLSEPPRSPRRVKVGDFEIGDCEVTNHQYLGFVEAGLESGALQVMASDPPRLVNQAGEAMLVLHPCTPDRPLEGCGIVMRDGRAFVPQGYENLPVIYVTQAGAEAYAARVGGQLPSLEEWLQAAGTQRFPTADGTIAPHLANIEFGMNADGRGIGHLIGVGCYPANPNGLHDLVGSVREWTREPGQAAGADFLAHPPDAATLGQRVPAPDHRTGFRVRFDLHPND